MIDDSSRSATIDRIWKLKRAMEKTDGTYTHFKLCLDNATELAPIL